MLEVNPSQALHNLLAILCGTNEDQKILDHLCESVKKADDEKFFFEDREFNYVLVNEVIYNPAVPKSFSEIAQVSHQLCWDAGGPEAGYVIDAEGNSVADSGFSFLVDDDPENYKRLKRAGGVKPAFCFGQNWTFFDPTRQLKNGENALAFISHEGEGWIEVKSADEFDYQQIFLRMISDAMCGTNYLPEIYC